MFASALHRLESGQTEEGSVNGREANLVPEPVDIGSGRRFLVVDEVLHVVLQ